MPTKRLPVSPMKIDAGWKLKIRKPASAAARVEARTSPSRLPSRKKK
ncbi:MAG: hypothetical protein R2708_01910 [Vicinamibacterales bacterium]